MPMASDAGDDEALERARKLCWSPDESESKRFSRALITKGLLLDVYDILTSCQLEGL